ncbi:MAG: hypothetical protein U0838_11380 [Chloroflexota bacterium]
MTQDSSLDDAPPSGSPVSGRIMAVLLVVAVIVVGVGTFVWLDIRGDRPLPGDPLTIQNDPPPPSGFVCGKDVIPPARLLVVGESLTLIASNGGAEIPVVWPAGYAAREDQGRGGLYSPTGYLVAREGQNIQERFFGSAAPDGTFHVCKIARD